LVHLVRHSVVTLTVIRVWLHSSTDTSYSCWHWLWRRWQCVGEFEPLLDSVSDRLHLSANHSPFITHHVTPPSYRNIMKLPVFN